MTSEPEISSNSPVGLAVVGLGRGFMLTLPSIIADHRLKLVAACDPRQEARTAFEEQFNGSSYTDFAELLSERDVEVVYVASPHQYHKDHAIAALKAGKHVLVDKPIAIKLADSRAIIEAAEKYNRHVAVGPCHSFDPQVQASLQLIKSGKYGQLRMLKASYYTDFMYRPRRPEEFNTSDGGGVIFSQGAHQIDIARLLSGGLVDKVAAFTGNWGKSRPSEGAYSALMQFKNGVCANLTYSGYAHYDSDENADWIGELGTKKSADDYGLARKNLRNIPEGMDEADLKDGRTFGRAELLPASIDNEHFGDLLLSLDHADIRVTPRELKIYSDESRETVPVDRGNSPRSGALDTIWQMSREDTAPIQDARWGHATLEACQGILSAAKNGTWQEMAEQISVPDYPASGN